jgi:hypothetical protein
MRYVPILSFAILFLLSCALAACGPVAIGPPAARPEHPDGGGGGGGTM